MSNRCAHKWIKWTKDSIDILQKCVLCGTNRETANPANHAAGSEK